jgi:hypothetical protein
MILLTQIRCIILISKTRPLRHLNRNRARTFAGAMLENVFVSATVHEELTEVRTQENARRVSGLHPLALLTRWQRRARVPGVVSAVCAL